jgi:hypothetical protein
MTCYTYRVFKDVRLLRNVSEEELPFNISPIRLHHRSRLLIVPAAALTIKNDI